MTEAEKPSRLYIPQPFASKTGAALTPIGIASGSTPNFEDGFPSQYSVPKSGGGSYVTRGQMNAIGNLASHNQYCDACGGIITFDPTLATKIGGYPKNAILQYVSNSSLYFVMSLVDNNSIDFRSAGIDGINWKIVGGGEGLIAPSWSRKNSQILASGTALQPAGHTMLASGRTSASGFIRGSFGGTFTIGSGAVEISVFVGGNSSSVLPATPTDFSDNSDCEHFAIGGFGSSGDNNIGVIPVGVGIPYSVWMYVSNPAPTITNINYSVRFYS